LDTKIVNVCNITQALRHVLFLTLAGSLLEIRDLFVLNIAVLVTALQDDASLRPGQKQGNLSNCSSCL